MVGALHHSHDIALVTGKDAVFTTSPSGSTTGRPPRYRRRPGVSRCSHRNEPHHTGATRGHCTFFDPAGNRNEAFTGGYQVDPEEPPITWTEAEMGRAIFYYDGVVDQHFLTVHS